jgi:hypothetical protein
VSAQTTQRTLARPAASEQVWRRALGSPWLWVAGLTVLAFMLRRYQLGAESLWFDEADIVAQARRPLTDLLGGFTRAGENGPLFVVVLHFWLSLLDGVPVVGRLMHLAFGPATEAPVRGLSALFGTAAVPVMFALGRRMGGLWVGLVGAALLALNPFHIWYSQDAKMYSLLVLLVLVTSVLYLAALERNTWGLWIAYVAATWVMLTSHSLSGLVLLAQVASTPFIVSRRAEHTAGTARNRWVRWGWAMLLIAAPVFPIAWLRLAALVTGTVETGNWYTGVGLGDILLTIFVKFAVNQSASWQLTRSLAISAEAVGAIAMGGLALAGAVALVWGHIRPDEGGISSGMRRVKRPYVLVALLWLVPVAVFWLVTLQLPLFHPRYLIMSLPAYLLVAAAGIVAAWRLNPILALVPLALLALATGTAYASFNYAPGAQKEDWRGAMSYVQDHIRLRDEIVVFPGYLASAVDMYFTPGGPGKVPDRPIEAVPSLKVENFGQRELEESLRKLSNCSERVWLVVSPPRMEQEDPEHRVLQWFQFNFHTFDTQVFNGVTVYGIAFNQVLDCWYPNPDWAEPHTFENGLEFLGYIYEWRDDDETPTQPDASYLPLTLYWRSDGYLDQDYEIRVQVVSPSGEVVKDESLGPLNGYFPMTQWPQRFQLMDYRDVRLPGGLTPGPYTVKVQVHLPGQPDKPLRLEDGSTEIVFKQPLQVVPWSP